ncbi:hypothetical protein BKA64DRAFT_655026 [Cadophora sp. MPI-SDFR-AT-0126]|nr:hypothetical protein BKA64DRAFT_655026 [Leotiomycetes sp. MPI-SDFR-AT-0126]
MESTSPTFPQFPRLPKELRLGIWTLALPGPCTIEQVWNHAKVKWEFVRGIPAVLQACSESRTEFLRNDNVQGVSVVYQCIMDIRPFYICYDLDTIYFQRQFHHFKLNLINEHLRFLQMDWGMEPYWWSGTQQGPTFLRSLPRLEMLTLVVTISRWVLEDGETETIMDIAKRHTAAQLQLEKSRYPDWRTPITNFKCRKDKVDWSIRSMAKGLLPENRSDNQHLYDLGRI